MTYEGDYVQFKLLDNCTEEMTLILPLIPFERSWHKGVRATFYFLGLAYFFIAIAIVSDTFMGAIEKITSKTKKIYYPSKRKDSSEPEYLEVKVWNDTVANLTLMALGSSAPEILLSTIETIGNDFQAQDLGPGTIVGSAAFNLFIIIAVCVMTVKRKKKIKLIKVFITTSIFSVLAYLWLTICLDLVSPNVVEIWEALVTLALFPILILVSFWADKNFGRKSKTGAEELDTEEILHHDDLYFKDGKIGKEGMVKFYEKFKEFPMLTDEDAARLAAVQLVKKKKRSRLFYLMQATRSLTGSKKVVPPLSKAYKAINETPDIPTRVEITKSKEYIPNKAIVDFYTPSLTVPEYVGKVRVRVIRHGKLDIEAKVKVESYNGTAQAGVDFVSVNEEVRFKPGETEHYIDVEIIDDNQWEPMEEFFLRLTLFEEDLHRKDLSLGNARIMEIVILDDDEPGVISLKKRGLLVKESAGIINIEVERKGGVDGEVGVLWRTIDVTAKSPTDYIGQIGKLKFGHGESELAIELEIVNNHSTKRNDVFQVELFEAEGGAKLGNIKKTTVTVIDDSEFESELDRMIALAEETYREMENEDDWATQIKNAIVLNGGDIENSTKTDYVLHFISFLWKVLFAVCIPPPRYWGGWPCFFISLACIGLLTAMVGDMANIFGCLVGLKPTVTAITFVALGTSLPDLFASRTAALQEDYADNAIGNVTGSNSVNVFLGLGIPWTLSAIYHRVKHNDEFEVKAGSLSFSVLIYTIAALVCLTLLFLRRKLFFFGKAELGGPKIPKLITGAILVSLWLIYITFSTLKAYDIIEFSLQK